MKTFYRFVRPLKLDEKRIELDTLPKGGVCLRFDENPEGGTLRFNYARCHPEDLFSKAAAKKIADHRASIDVSMCSVPFTEDTTKLVADVIEYCMADHGVPTTYLEIYKRAELRELGQALQLLVARNDAEHRKAEIYKTAWQAARYVEGYENLSR